MQISHDALLHICSFLKFSTWPSVASVCKHWYQLSKQQALWKLFWHQDLQAKNFIIVPQFTESKCKGKQEKLETHKYCAKREKILQFVFAKSADFCSKFLRHCFSVNKTLLRMQRNILIRTKELKVDHWCAYFQLYDQMMSKFGSIFSQQLIHGMKVRHGKRTMLHIFAKQTCKSKLPHDVKIQSVLHQLTSPPLSFSIYAVDEHKRTPLHYFIESDDCEIVACALQILKQQCEQGVVTEDDMLQKNMPLRHAIACGASEGLVRMLLNNGIGNENSLYGLLLCNKDTFKFDSKQNYLKFYDLSDLKTLFTTKYSCSLLQDLTIRFSIDWFAKKALSESALYCLTFFRIDDLELDKISYIVSLLELHENKQLMKDGQNYFCLCWLMSLLRKMKFDDSTKQYLGIIERMLALGANVSQDEPYFFRHSFIVLHFQKDCKSMEVWHAVSDLLVKNNADFGVQVSSDKMSLIDNCAQKAQPFYCKVMIAWLLKHGKTCYSNERLKESKYAMALVAEYPHLEYNLFHANK